MISRPLMAFWSAGPSFHHFILWGHALRTAPSANLMNTASQMEQRSLMKNSAQTTPSSGSSPCITFYCSYVSDGCTDRTASGSWHWNVEMCKKISCIAWTFPDHAIPHSNGFSKAPENNRHMCFTKFLQKCHSSKRQLAERKESFRFSFQKAIKWTHHI